MNVVHETETTSHIAMGGQQAQAMTINSNNSQLFNILATNLYSNPLLATIREIMCNAWDAHLDSGIDTPLCITLTPDSVTIRDFGKGIPDSEINAVYCTLGESTKANKSSLTGGLGLGSKAPFSYSPHFQVVSCHEGVKTIYHLSKSSFEMEGVPSIKKMIGIPTTDTGLTVIVPIKSAYDSGTAHNYVKELAYWGGIPITFNGKVQEYVSYVNGYAVNNNFRRYRNIESILNARPTEVIIKYGSVLYNIGDTLSHATKELVKFYSLYPTRADRVRTILVAENDSLTVSPNREQLVMNPTTVAAITKLIDNFVEFLKTSVPKEIQKELDSFISQAALLPEAKHSPFSALGYDSDCKKATATNTADLATLLFTGMSNIHSCPTDKDVMITLIKELQKNKAIPYHLAKSHLAKHKKSNWFERNILAPIIKKLVTPDSINKLKIQLYRYSKLTSIENCGSIYIDEQRKFLFPTLVLGTFQRIFSKPVFMSDGIKIDTYLYYQLSRKKDVRAQEIANFTKLKHFNIVNLSSKEEVEDIPDTDTPKVIKPRVKRNLDLINIKHTLSHGSISKHYLSSAHPTISDPKFVGYTKPSSIVYGEVIFATKTGTITLAPSMLGIIHTILGETGGLTTSKVTYDLLIKKGVPNLFDVLVDKLIDLINSQNNLQNSIYVNKELQHYPKGSLITSILTNEEICKHFNVPLFNLDKQNDLNIIRDLIPKLDNDMLNEVLAAKKAQPVDANLLKLVDSLDDDLLKYIDHHEVIHAIKTNVKLDKMISLINFVSK